MQALSITLTNLRALPARWGSAVVVVIGVAGVVAVLTSVLTMAIGLTNTTVGGAREGWAVVVRDGAFAESLSALPREAVIAVEDAPGIQRRADGSLAIERQYIEATTLFRQSDPNLSASVAIRGLDSQALQGLSGFQLTAGRMFATGKRELIAGTLGAGAYQGLEIGSEVVIKGANWTVVGHFKAPGTPQESELLADLTTLMGAVNRTAFSSLRVQLVDEEALAGFAQALEDDPRAKVEAQWEADYFATNNTGAIIGFIAYVVSSIMAVGALFGALNVMYTAVAARTKEIATLRALGFARRSVMISVLGEALLLGLIGALVGVAICVAMFHGTTFTTASINSVTAELTVTPGLAATGVVWGLVIGLIGGLFPAVSAARSSITSGLRS